MSAPSTDSFVVGVDLGGTKLLAAAVGRDLAVHHRALRGSQGVPQAQLLDLCVEAVEEADNILAELQDSMRPVEVGDPELRAGLAETRELLGTIPDRAHRLLSTLGR